jgi:peptidyl-dipeptidase Dcp
LGFENHAAYVLADETAASTAAVNKMLAELAPAALANASAELHEMQALVDAEAKSTGSPTFTLAAWDWAYYAERVREDRYAYDESEVRPYFEVNRVMEDGVLYAAEQLFGLEFKERHDVPTYQADVRTFEVFDASGSPFGLVFMDYYARSNKQGGAWMSNFIDQSRLLGLQPVVINNLNVVKPPPGQPALMTLDEVITAFHEFGHALHSLLSDVAFPYFSGTNVPRDFVEFPSQWNEMWATHPEVIGNYAKHHESGKPIPHALLDKLLAARKFNQGFATTEYLAAAIIDQAWHQLAAQDTPSAQHVMEFEAKALKQAGLDLEAVHPRYHTPYFSHLFSSGYAAAYYAYIWSDVLARDGEHWFKSRGGLRRMNGDELRNKVLAKGGSVEAATLFQSFYGGPPDIGPLLEHRGLTLERV